MKTLYAALLAFSFSLSLAAAPEAPGVPGVPGQIMVKGLPAIQGDTKGYNLYISTQEKTGYAKLNSEPITNGRFLAKDLLAGQRYWFAFTALALDDAGQLAESKPSEKWSLFAEKVRGDETPTPGAQPAKKPTPQAQATPVAKSKAKASKPKH